MFNFRFTLIQSTWLEKASERPSFATIVTTLSQSDLLAYNYLELRYVII